MLVVVRDGPPAGGQDSGLNQYERTRGDEHATGERPCGWDGRGPREVRQDAQSGHTSSPGRDEGGVGPQWK